MNWNRLTKKRAAEILQNWKAENRIGIVEPTTEPSGTEYRLLRQQLLEAWKKAGELAGDEKKIYPRDIEFGLRVYQLLVHPPFSMTPRTAADDDIWRYIAFQVIPEVCTERWPADHRLSRMVKESRRLFPKNLWWYVYLCWQGSEDETRKLVQGLGEDTIAQLVERKSTTGYDAELYRQIIHGIGLYRQEHTSAETTEMFRHVMKLNTARILTTVPALTAGGTAGYAEELFDYFNET